MYSIFQLNRLSCSVGHATYLNINILYILVEMGCPVLLGPASDGPCVDTCKDDSDCGFEEKCCSALDGCSMCQQVDKFGIYTHDIFAIFML